MPGTHLGVPLGHDEEGAAPPRTTRTAPEDVCRARRVGHRDGGPASVQRAKTKAHVRGAGWWSLRAGGQRAQTSSYRTGPGDALRTQPGDHS